MSDTDLPTPPVTPAKSNPSPSAAPPVLLACTVTAATAKIGKLLCGKGHKCHLPQDQANALKGAGLISIDGI